MIGIAMFPFQGHEYSPMIYNYDERKGTIDFVEKLDQPEAPVSKLAAGLDWCIWFLRL